MIESNFYIYGDGNRNGNISRFFIRKHSALIAIITLILAGNSAFIERDANSTQVGFLVTS